MISDIYHITKNGSKILLKDMTDKHLVNTINRIKRLAEEGVVLESGSLSFVYDDFSYDREVYYDEEAEDTLELNEYLLELVEEN